MIEFLQRWLPSCAIVALAVSSALATNTFVITTKAGVQSGPFEFRDGGMISAGDATFTIQLTPEQRMKMRLASIILPEVEFRQTPVDEAIRDLNALIKSQPSSPGNEPSTNVCIKLVTTNFIYAATDEYGENLLPKNDLPDITFQARDIALLTLLNIIAKLGGLTCILKDGSVELMQLIDSQTPMIIKLYYVEPTFVEDGGPAAVATADEYVNKYSEIKRNFIEMGIPFPPGASIVYNSLIGKLFVRNTPKNIAKLDDLMAELNLIPSQVEIDTHFVQFPRDEIAQLASSGTVLGDSLLHLWQSGKGELIAAPKVATRSGSEAVTKHITSSRFEDCGATATCAPEISPNGSSLSLSLISQYAYKPEWRSFAFDFSTSNGVLQHLTTERPFFHHLEVKTEFRTFDGKTHVVGGGLPTPDNKGLVYIFVSTRKIGADGKPVHKPASPN